MEFIVTIEIGLIVLLFMMIGALALRFVEDMDEQSKKNQDYELRIEHMENYLTRNSSFNPRQ